MSLTPADESKSPATLERLHILDEGCEERFNRLARIAAQTFEVPIALISLVEEQRCRFKAYYGLQITEVDLESSFWIQALPGEGVFQVADAMADPGFRENAPLRGEHDIRFYAAAPLRTGDGYNLGAFWIMDYKPRILSEREQNILQELAASAMDQVELSPRRAQLGKDAPEQFSTREARNESEERYRQLLETTNEGILIIDIREKISFANPRIAQFLGYEVGELLGLSIFDLIYESDTALQKARFERRRQGINEQFEARLRGKDGAERWVIVSAVPIFDNGGEYNGSFSMITDITGRKRAEEALATSQARFHGILEIASDIIILLDENYEITLFNQGAEKTFGYSSAEMLGKPLDVLLPGELASRHRQYFYNFARFGSSPRKMGTKQDISGRRKDGTLFPVEASISMLDLNGEKTFAVIMRDLTEIKQALEETYYQARLLDSVEEAVIATDLNGAVRYWNCFAEKLYGWSAQEASGQNILLLTPSVTAREMAAEIMSSLQAGNSWTGEFNVKRRDGLNFLAQVTNSPIINAEGQLVGVVGISSDITARKMAEEALSASQERFSKAFSSAPFPITITRLSDGFYLDANNSFCALTGYSREELKRLSATELLWGGIQKRQEVVEVMLRQGYLRDWEVEFKTKAGNMLYLLLSGEVITLDGEDCILSNFKDITERILTREALERAEERLQTVITNAPVILFSLDREGIITLSEGKALETLGDDFKKLAGRSIFELYQNLPEAVAIIEQVMAGEVVNAEINLGNVFIEVFSRPLFDKNGNFNGATGVAIDITEKKRAQEELKKREEQLRLSQKMEAIGQLAGGVAHDFNNLLTAVLGYVDLMLYSLHEQDPLRSNVLEIEKAARRAASLTQQLLAFSRKQVLQPELLNLNEVVRDMDQMFRRLIGENIELINNLETEVVTVRADQGQLEQVLLNLVINARDAMPQGGALTLETRKVELDENYSRLQPDVRPGSYVLLAVSDTGMGMDSEILNHIFEPFFTTKAHGKGTGLGLSTVYGIVKQSGGHISVYSEQGTGTVFKIYLPLAGEVPAETRPPVKKPAYLLGRETVLVVEDEEQIRLLIRKVLEMNGYKVLEARNGKEAVFQLKTGEGPIHLLLSDLIMPQMGGPELARYVRQQHPEIKVLFISGYTNNALEKEDFIAQGINFLHKPFSTEDLVRKLRQALDSESNPTR